MCSCTINLHIIASLDIVHYSCCVKLVFLFFCFQKVQTSAVDQLSMVLWREVRNCSGVLFLCARTILILINNFCSVFVRCIAAGSKMFSVYLQHIFMHILYVIVAFKLSSRPFFIVSLSVLLQFHVFAMQSLFISV